MDWLDYEHYELHDISIEGIDQEVDKLEQTRKETGDRFPWADYAFNTLLIVLNNEKHRDLVEFYPAVYKAGDGSYDK